MKKWCKAILFLLPVILFVGAVNWYVDSYAMLRVTYDQIGEQMAVYGRNVEGLEESDFNDRSLLLACMKQQEARDVIVAGDSAGGNLALALVHKLKGEGRILPRGLALMSPWTDLTCSGESHETNFHRDPQFGGTTDNMLHNSPYIGEASPKDPYLSPAFGSFEKMPPILMQVGSEEVLLSDTLTVADKLRASRSKLRVSVYDGMFHEFQMAL